MPTYQRSEDLPDWKDAIRLAEEVEDFPIAAKSHPTHSKRHQFNRASLSVSNNIAEGLARGTKAELLAFPYIARGSGGEVGTMFSFFDRRPDLKDCRSQISILKCGVLLPTATRLG
jgi:four helix bundle protein